MVELSTIIAAVAGSLFVTGGKLVGSWLHDRYSHSEQVELETERIERHKIAHAMVAEYEDMVLMKQEPATPKLEPIYKINRYGLFQTKVVVGFKESTLSSERFSSDVPISTFMWCLFKSTIVCMSAVIVGLIAVPLSLAAKLFMLWFRWYRSYPPSQSTVIPPPIYDEPPPPPVHGWMDTPPQNFQPFQADKVKETNDDNDTTADFGKLRFR